LRGNKKLRDLIAWAPSAIKQRVCCAFNYDLGKDESWAGERGKQHVHPSLSISLALRGGIGLEMDLMGHKCGFRNQDLLRISFITKWKKM
jgi:hypothetical protein